MLIKEIPTPPASPSTGTNGGNRETPSQVRQENPNPSTPTTAPPQTSTPTPDPEVDEEALRHLDKILRSIPRELDDAAAYAELKARLGISRSRAKASSSKTKILPKSPPSTIHPSPPSPPKTTSPVQTLPLSPLPNPPTSSPPSPIQPSPPSPTQPMQCSESTSDREGLREDYGQPFAVPSPTSGGDPTSIHEPHLTEGGNNNDEEVEELRPLFDYEGVGGEEEEPLRRYTRRMTMDKLLGEAEGLKSQGKKETTVQRPRTERKLVDEEESEEPQTQEAGEEPEAATSSLARKDREKKRKGKGSVLPTPERRQPANVGVVITDTPTPVPSLPRDEGSESEDQELHWPRTTKRQQGKSATSLSTTHAPQYVVLTPALRQQMLEFDDPKMQKEVHQRVTSQKKLKAGKMLHQPSLEKIEMKERFSAYITGIGFEWLLEIDETPVPEDLAKEFFTSFRFTRSPDLHDKSISFRVFGQEQLMSLNDFSIRMGLYTEDQVANGVWVGRDIGLPQRKPDFDQQAVWKAICGGRAPTFRASESRGHLIADPALRLAQVYLACNLLGQANTLEILTLAELYFMWSMREQRKVHLGFWLAYSINQMATHAARHLNVCHLLGAYLRRNWTVKNVGRPILCPSPEMFDLDFFVRIQVLEKTQGGSFQFYAAEQQRSQPQKRRRLEESSEAPADGEEEDTHQAPTPRMEQEEAASIDNDWKLRMEQQLTQLVENSNAQLVLLARLLGTPQEMTPVRRPPLPSTSSPVSRRPSSSRPFSASPSNAPKKT